MTQELDISCQDIGAIANVHAGAAAFADYHSRKSSSTITRQLHELATFARYLADVGIHTTAEALASDPQAWRGMTWGLIAAFVQWQLKQGYAVGTVNLQLSTVRTYAGLAAKVGVIAPDEAHMIQSVSGYSRKENRNIDAGRAQSGSQTRLSTKKQEAVSLSDSQIKALKDDHADTPQGRRDRLLMCLLLNLGLRVGELVLLRASDVDLKAGTLQLYRPKVGLTQIHELINGTMDAARAYIQQDVIDTTAPLLRASNKHGTLTHAGMTRYGIAQRVRDLGRAVGIANLSPHDCRHSWATRAAKHSDAFSLRDAGGWASMAMPGRYVEAAKVANKGIKLSE